MPTFAGNSADLLDATMYEMQVIDYLRATLYGQTERPGDGLTLVFGSEPGAPPKRLINLRVDDSMSASAVAQALNHIRPLAFSAAFKMQDMIVEWTLRANGVKAWPFKKKLEAYDNLRAAGGFLQHDFLSHNPSVSSAFWQLYRYFVEFRGTVVHSGGVVLDADGTVTIRSRSGDVLRLTQYQQGAYLQAMSLMCRIFCDSPFPVHLPGMVEQSLAALQPYHRETGLKILNARLEVLKVQIPASAVKSLSPLCVEVDFDLLRREMERQFPLGVGGQLFYSTIIEVISDDSNKLAATWRLPPEMSQCGTVLLKEGDLQFDHFLQKC